MYGTYSNSNHAVQRKGVMNKTASVYDRMAQSNRGMEKRALHFPSLPPHQSEDILSVLKKEAEILDGLSMQKEASIMNSPFELFGNTKQYVSSKLGLDNEIAHELTSSVLNKAKHLQEVHGGEIEAMVSGIVDQIDPASIEAKVGAYPMRKSSPNEVEEMVKQRLMEQMQLSSYQADQFKKIVVSQARNLSTGFRQYEIVDIAGAIVRVLVEHQDISVAYNISTSDRLRSEVEHHLTNS